MRMYHVATGTVVMKKKWNLDAFIYTTGRFVNYVDLVIYTFFYVSRILAMFCLHFFLTLL